MSGSTKPTLFLSDLHLSPDRPGALRAFHAFAAGPARDAAAVYMLGDIFDWWVGDDQMRIPFVADVVKSMRGISDDGVALYIGQGNRDFLIGERLARAAGPTLLPGRLANAEDANRWPGAEYFPSARLRPRWSRNSQHP